MHAFATHQKRVGVVAIHAVFMGASGGGLWWELPPSMGPIPAELLRLLGRLDGVERFSFILWKMPEGKRLDQVDQTEDAQEYCQSAGSAMQMTVEVRRIVGGRPQQLVVGRRGPVDPEPSVDIPWSTFTVHVRQNEVFDAQEAAEIFNAYYDTGWVPAGYVLREIEL